MGLRNLGVVKEIVEAVDMDISHAYEDLVFLTHNALLLQFAADDETVLVHRNQEADPSELNGAIQRLKEAAADRETLFLDGDRYTITQMADETLGIEFLPTAR